MTAKPPEYSICVLHHGALHFTEACLRSSLALNPPPLERIVLWNDTVGDPGDLPGELVDAVRIVDPGANLGFTGGANLGIAAALEDRRAEAVWLLNNDTRLEPDAPRRLLEVLAAEPDVGMVGPRIVQHDTGRIWHDGGHIEWPEARPLSPHFGDPLPSDTSVPFEVGFTCGCAPLIRASAFQEVGGFDDRYFIFYEDADLSMRMRNAGWRLVHVPAARVWHHGSATTGEGSPFSRYYRLRNRLLFSAQHAPDLEAARLERQRLERRSRTLAWKRLLTGRFREGRAILAALADARCGRWGRQSSLGLDP